MLNKKEILNIVNNALREDIKTGDITTNSLIPPNKKAKAKLIAKEEGVIAGGFVAKLVFQQLDPKVKWKQFVKDGTYIHKGMTIAEITGSYRALLSGERTALNFLQRMSGIATLTRKFVNKLHGTNTKILDTRKTAPGLRILDKYAVKTGGGENHRMGLYDLIMIKDNHIEAVGSITKAVEQIKAKSPKKVKIEVETKNLREVKEALNCKVDIIMLDNMSLKNMTKAVKLINSKALVEASGKMTLDKIKKTANTGVDFISVGALTHSVKALDIGMYIVSKMPNYKKEQQQK
ncbi:carboxylating nicotinate-nucleotide diphosphorylase [Melioribacteraceae bacterium 4301-Me]|uniref:carboxylating nicotinate-nucleotide diphosphorylase n=1 Tax=Pyranulibacter aquaticus TaxID=3163344 RepID=UPI0035969998